MGPILTIIEEKRRLLLLAVIILGGVVFFIFFNRVIGKGVEQPISFNHKTHKEQGLECISCHQYVEEQTFAGLPRIEVCLECHEEPITDSPEEEKIRTFHKEGIPIQWISLYNQPDHVFFSHRRHIRLGQIDCRVCHGQFDETTTPPRRPLVTLTMDDCMDCHEERRESNDCLVCHI